MGLLIKENIENDCLLGIWEITKHHNPQLFPRFQEDNHSQYFL